MDDLTFTALTASDPKNVALAITIPHGLTISCSLCAHLLEKTPEILVPFVPALFWRAIPGGRVWILLARCDLLSSSAR